MAADIAAAILLGGSLTAGLDALDYKYPPTVEIGVLTSIFDNNFCHDQSNHVGFLSITQPLARWNNQKSVVELSVSYKHLSCLEEEDDKQWFDVYGVTLRITADFL